MADELKPTITGAAYGIKPTDVDHTILAKRTAVWEAVQGPRVGDFVRFPDGKLHRFSHDWGEDIQHSKQTDASFYFAGECMSFSGGLEPPILKSRLRDTGEMRLGSAWFFQGNWPRAHSAVYVMVPCRVYEYSE